MAIGTVGIDGISTVGGGDGTVGTSCVVVVRSIFCLVVVTGLTVVGGVLVGLTVVGGVLVGLTVVGGVLVGPTVGGGLLIGPGGLFKFIKIMST